MKETNTERKIIEAAHKVFTKKGYAGTRTRDIAAEANINLALLNYYFRSKQKLFEKIMSEQFQQLLSVVLPVVNDEGLTLEEKISLLVERYIDLLQKNPNLPIFILSEIKNNPDIFNGKINYEMIFNHSSLAKQLKELRPDIAPIQWMMSLLGMIVFPFVMHPVLDTNLLPFENLMEERKVLIKKWMQTILHQA